MWIRLNTKFILSFLPFTFFGGVGLTFTRQVLLLLESPHQPFFVIDFFEIGSRELFGSGFKQWSSWSLPPKLLGLQATVISSQLPFTFYSSVFSVILNRLHHPLQVFVISSRKMYLNICANEVLFLIILVIGLNSTAFHLKWFCQVQFQVVIWSNHLN
jgi:hypothetical protein